MQHEWSEPSLANGRDVYTCLICNYSKSQAHTHILSDAWTNNDASHWKKCTVHGCLHTEAKSTHNWVSEGFISIPSPDRSGEEKFKCDICELTKIQEVEYIPPKMSKSKWLSYFVFDNLKLQNTYSFGEDLFVDTWLIDGENIFITSEEDSYYGTLSDVDSFAFLRDYYDSFTIVGEGQYHAQNVLYYDPELEENVSFKDVSIYFSDTRILKIEFTADLGIFGEMTDIYDFLDWGGIVVPENPRETVTPPESISKILGYSLDNFTMKEIIESDGEFYNTVYFFDGNKYCYTTVGEEAVIDYMPDAGAAYAYDAVGFFYALNPEKFILDENNLDESIRVYNYERGITANGTDIDYVTVKLYYEENDVCKITLSYTLDLFGTTSFEYTFTDFGATEIDEPEKALVNNICGKSINQVSVAVNEISGGKTDYTKYSFDYSDYECGDDEFGYTYGRLNNSAAVFITDWLGSLVDFSSSDFETVSIKDTEKQYKTTKPVISKGITYTTTEIVLAYTGSKATGYELNCVYIRLRGGDGGKSVHYTISDFGSVFIDTKPEESKEIPEGYLTTLAKEASLSNYILFITESFRIDGEDGGVFETVYEFDYHKGRFYPKGNTEASEYLSEDYVGMAYATEILSLFSLLDQSKYECVSAKTVGNTTKLSYEYTESSVVEGITVSNVNVFLTYENGTLTFVDISYDMSSASEYGELCISTSYSFCSFGEVSVVLPEDNTVAKFRYERIDTDNYSYTTTIYKNEISQYSASGKYDSNKYFEQNSDDKYGNCYYTENAGLRDYHRYFGALLACFSQEELVLSGKTNYEGYDFAHIYTASAMKSLRVSIGSKSLSIAASGFNFTFFYADGEIVRIMLSYDANIDGKICRVESELYGFGEQLITTPSEHDFNFDSENTYEFCGNSLDNYILQETVTKSGITASRFSGYFEKDYAKYNVMNGTTNTESFIGAADNKGKEILNEKLGFIYSLNTEGFVLYGASENSVIFGYNSTITVATDKITNLEIRLTYDETDIDELTFITVIYTRTKDGTAYYYELTLSSFGKVSIVRPDQPNENALPQYLYNAMINPKDTLSATLETKKMGQNGGESGYASYDDAYESNGEYYVTTEKMVTYTTFEEAKAAYEEHFAPFIDVLGAITPSKLIYYENIGVYMLSEGVSYNGYRFITATVEVIHDDKLYIHVFIHGKNSTEDFTLDLRLIAKNA